MSRDSAYEVQISKHCLLSLYKYNYGKEIRKQMGRSNNGDIDHSNNNNEMSREELKRMFLTFPTEGRPTVKTITVQMDRYKDRLGQGTVRITRDGPNGLSECKSSQSNPMEYALTSKEYMSGDYELIIK